jgi:hypothetical protein
MALDGASFSPKEFKLAISSTGEATQGTAKTDALIAVNIDSLEMPSFNLTQVLDVRSGTDGRVADIADAFTDEKGVTKEITFSGILDSQVLPILLENCIARGNAQSVVTIPYNYEPPALATGATSQNQIHTLTLHLSLPATTDSESSPGTDTHSMTFPGCTITSLQITGDMGNESGRLRFTATARTGYITTFSTAEIAPTAYTSNFFSLATLAGSGLKTIAGAKDCVIQSFSLNFENPSEYVGQHDSNGNPEAIVRAVPEIAVTLDATVKYDNNNAAGEQTTAEYQTAMKANTTVATSLHNHATSIDSATGFGFEGAFGKITNVAFNEANAMMVDVSTKFFASGTSNMFEIRY